MDWRTAIASFLIVFVSEIGDKTQLTTMTVAAESRAPLMVFVGAAAALVLSAMLGVIFGETLLNFLPLRYVRFGAGVIFVALGCLLLFRHR